MADWARWIQALLTMKDRVDNLIDGLRRVETKLDGFIERLARLEQNYLHLRESVKNEIAADLKADVIGTNARLDVELRELRSELREDLISSLGREARLGERGSSRKNQKI